MQIIGGCSIYCFAHCKMCASGDGDNDLANRNSEFEEVFMVTNCMPETLLIRQPTFM